ncbi:MAG: hypothetical protein ACOC8E_07885 [Planctomycetota bacterium]
MTSENKQVLVLSGLFGIVALFIFVGCGVALDFHVGLNDFWMVRFYAEKMTLSEPASLYNGFFPIGYPLLLKLVPSGAVLPAAYMFSAVCGALVVVAAALLLGGVFGRWGAAAGFLVATFHPLVFRYGNTAGPYVGTAAFTALAVYLLWKDAFRTEEGRPSQANLVFAGLLLGLAALFRSHCIVSSGAVLISYCGPAAPGIAGPLRRSLRPCRRAHRVSAPSEPRFGARRAGDGAGVEHLRPDLRAEFL